MTETRNNLKPGQVIIAGRAIGLDVAAGLMDDDLRETVHRELAPCADQAFANRYCELHREKYGADFIVN